MLYDIDKTLNISAIIKAAKDKALGFAKPAA